MRRAAQVIGPAALGHAVDLRERHPERVEPRQEVGGDGRGAADGRVELVEAEHLAGAAEARGRRGPRRWRAPRGWPRPHARCREMGAASSMPSANLAAFSGLFASARRHAGVHLLVHPRHAEHHLGPDVAEVGGELAGLGAGDHLVAERDHLVVAVHALGDVRHRQVRHQALALVARRTASGQPEALDRPADVGVSSHHALGRTGRARGVDDGGQVVGRPRPRRPARGRRDRARAGRRR